MGELKSGIKGGLTKMKHFARWLSGHSEKVNAVTKQGYFFIGGGGEGGGVSK